MATTYWVEMVATADTTTAQQPWVGKIIGVETSPVLGAYVWEVKTDQLQGVMVQRGDATFEFRLGATDVAASAIDAVAAPSGGWFDATAKAAWLNRGRQLRDLGIPVAQIRTAFIEMYAAAITNHNARPQ